MTNIANAKIYGAIAAIMGNLGAIGKDKHAAPGMGGYSYRGIDAVYNGLQKLMAQHEVISIPTVLERVNTIRKTANGGTLYHVQAKIRYVFYHADGSSVPAEVYGEGMDTGDKASNKAMSIAHKYALTQTFCLMTEDVTDPDDSRPENESAAPPARPTPPAAPKNEAPKPPTSGGALSEPQIKRLWAIANKNHWSTEQVHAFMARTYRIDSIKGLTYANYEHLCKTMETPQ